MLRDGELPKVEQSANGLGVRTEGEHADIVVRDGMVTPDHGGMSVAPALDRLPFHRVPLEFRTQLRSASCKDPNQAVWTMGSGPFERESVATGLMLRPDEPNSAGMVKHGVVEPSEVMSLTAYHECLAETAGSWRKLEPEEA